MASCLDGAFDWGPDAAVRSSKSDGVGPCTRRRRSELDRLRPDQGREQAGRRPALVVSSAAFTENTGPSHCLPYHVACPAVSDQASYSHQGCRSLARY